VLCSELPRPERRADRARAHQGPRRAQV